MPDQMDGLQLSDVDAHRLARFVSDLMATLAEDGVAGAESAEAVSALWQAIPTDATPSHVYPIHLTRGADLDAATLVHGLTAVSAALVAQLVTERHAAGYTGATAGEVWREVAAALGASDDDTDIEDNSTGTFDPS